MARKIGVTVVLRQDQLEWVENHDGNMSEAVRQAIDSHTGLEADE